MKSLEIPVLIKTILTSFKWGVIGAVMLSGWIMAAWIKADLRPGIIQPLPTPISYEIVAQEPGRGQEWAFQDCVKVRYLQDTNENATKHPGTPGQKTSGVETKIQEGHALPLGRFLVPASGRDPIQVIPELDPVSGETKLQVEPAGGFARFGGERYAFVDLSYVNQLQGFQDAASSPSLDIGLHQDLGRLGKLELMAEGWLGASLLSIDNQTQSVLSVGVKVRVALPF